MERLTRVGLIVFVVSAMMATPLVAFGADVYEQTSTEISGSDWKVKSSTNGSYRYFSRRTLSRTRYQTTYRYYYKATDKDVYTSNASCSNAIAKYACALAEYTATRTDYYYRDLVCGSISGPLSVVASPPVASESQLLLNEGQALSNTVTSRGRCYWKSGYKWYKVRKSGSLTLSPGLSYMSSSTDESARVTASGYSCSYSSGTITDTPYHQKACTVSVSPGSSYTMDIGSTITEFSGGSRHYTNRSKFWVPNI